MPKANAALLFPAARATAAIEPICEVGVMADSSVDQEKRTHSSQRGFTAILTVPTGIGRNWSVAAKGQSCDSIVASLHSLFEVTAAGLEKYQGNIFNGLDSPTDIGGGLMDESLVKQTKGNSWFG